MRAPAADSMAAASVDGAEAAGSNHLEPPARRDEPAIPAKAKDQNIRVSPAVLDATGKDGEELLRSLRPVAAMLKAMIHVTATVVRDGETKEMPLRDLVPGDYSKLSAGDMIPGEVLVVSCKDLFVSEGNSGTEDRTKVFVECWSGGWAGGAKAAVVVTDSARGFRRACRVPSHKSGSRR